MESCPICGDAVDGAAVAALVDQSCQLSEELQSAASKRIAAIDEAVAELRAASDIPAPGKASATSKALGRAAACIDGVRDAAHRAETAEDMLAEAIADDDCEEVDDETPGAGEVATTATAAVAALEAAKKAVVARIDAQIKQVRRDADAAAAAAASAEDRAETAREEFEKFRAEGPLGKLLDDVLGGLRQSEAALDAEVAKLRGKLDGSSPYNVAHDAVRERLDAALKSHEECSRLQMQCIQLRAAVDREPLLGDDDGSSDGTRCTPDGTSSDPDTTPATVERKRRRPRPAGGDNDDEEASRGESEGSESSVGDEPDIVIRRLSTFVRNASDLTQSPSPSPPPSRGPMSESRQRAEARPTRRTPSPAKPAKPQPASLLGKFFGRLYRRR